MRNNMPYSPPTLQLLSTASACGDEYYHYVTNLAQRGIECDETCVTLAEEYLAELEKLDAHLATLPPNGEVSALKLSTMAYIELLQKDLKRYAAFGAVPSA